MQLPKEQVVEAMTLPDQTAVRPILLQVLAELGGRARPKDVYPRVTEHFPELTPADLTAVLQDGRTNRWQNRIQWTRQDLVLAGLLDSAERGIWQLTSKGQDVVRRGATPADFVAPRDPANRRPRDDAPEVPALEPPTTALGTDVPPPPAVISVLQPASAVLADELRAAAVDSRDPNRLEHVVADAFRFLGFEATWIGGAGKTDVLVHAPLGIKGYSAVVDAKSTARGKVTDAQVDWLSIRAHREQERAQYACVVGTDFAGGQLNTRALEFQVSLLPTEALAELLTIHGDMPLTLAELRTLFTTIPAAIEALPQLRANARERRRKRLLIVRLLAHIDNFNRVQPDIVLAKPETLLASVLAERNSALLGTTLEDIRRTLSLLETTGIITAANGEGYISDTTIEGARQLLAAFATPPEDEPQAPTVDSRRGRLTSAP